MSPTESIAKLLEKRTWWEYVSRIIGMNGWLAWRTRAKEKLIRIDHAIAIHERRLKYPDELPAKAGGGPHDSV